VSNRWEAQVTDDQGVSNRVALVTGVSRLDGIAAAVVRKLARDGWDVVMTGWPAYDESFPWGADPHVAEQLLNEVAAHGRLGSYFLPI
jgi:3-oxoacyl-[acyl-carrier protein] reductase